MLQVQLKFTSGQTTVFDNVYEMWSGDGQLHLRKKNKLGEMSKVLSFASESIEFQHVMTK